MDRLVNFVRRLVRAEDGQDLLEYAMLVRPDRARRHRRGDTAGQHDQHGVLAGHCRFQHLTPSCPGRRGRPPGAAAAIDVRTGKIPNALTAGVAGSGARRSPPSGLTGHSVAAAAIGGVLGFVMMLPGHVLGGTGAGDVKLSPRSARCSARPACSWRCCMARSRAACSPSGTRCIAAASATTLSTDRAARRRAGETRRERSMEPPPQPVRLRTGHRDRRYRRGAPGEVRIRP